MRTPSTRARATSTTKPSLTPTVTPRAWRAIADLTDPQASVFIYPGGQSGNPLSPHYRDFTAAWARGEYVPMITNRRRLEADGVQRLVLTPRK